MKEPWVSVNGVELRDLVPEDTRRAWVDQGFCPGQDLYSLFADHVHRHPHRDAVIDSEGSLDYGALGTRVREAAATLACAGLGSRDIVGIALPNGRNAVVAELAVAAIGAVALPYAGKAGDRDFTRLLDRSRAGAAIVDEPFPLPCRVFSFDTGFPDKHSGSWSPRPVDPEAPARIMVSSGSEADTKMIAYSHNAIAGGRAAYVRALCRYAGPPRNLVLVPLASSFGSCGIPVTIAALGGTLLVQQAFDRACALRMITRHRPTHVFGVPTMLRRIADQPPEAGEDLTSLETVVSSGAALPASTAKAARERFGCRVVTVYGSSDGVNCHTALSEVGVGRPDPVVAAIRIADARGHDAASGDTGEICALGPMTPLCYVEAPELDQRYRLPGGWVRTGDAGWLDETGHLHLDGRIKQIVVRGGYNVSLSEVEREVAHHPGITDVACVPAPDDDLGERLCACVAVTHGGKVTLPGLRAFLVHERGLDRRKLPELLVVLPRLPVGVTGKVCRRTLTSWVSRPAARSQTLGAALFEGDG